MRIAIPISDGQVANHLGACQKFLIADTDDGHIKEIIEVSNPGHGPGGPPPVFLAQLGVRQVVAWGLPAHAKNMFDQLGVKVQLGAKGEPGQVLNDYLAGTLTYVSEGLDGGGSCSHDHSHK